MSFRPLLMAAPAVLLFALAMPASANNSGPGNVELAQATPPAPPAPPAPGARGERGERRAFSPKAVCQDHVARRIGYRAYLKARLELKAEQMNAWNAFEKAADDASAKAMTRCATLPTESKDRPNVVERLTLEEDALKARIASIEAVKPTLGALYAVLSPEQKALFDRPRGPMHERMERMRGAGPR